MPRKKIIQDDKDQALLQNTAVATPGTEDAAPPKRATASGKKGTKGTAKKGTTQPEELPRENTTAETAAEASWPLGNDEEPPFHEVAGLPEEQGAEEVATPADEDDKEPTQMGKGRRRRSKSERQQFFELQFSELDRYLTEEERKEWNSIYASYRGRSAMTGTVIGVDRLSVGVKNQVSGEMERKDMYCAIVVPYRVRIVIPAPEMWEKGQERPDFVLQNMVGASIDFIITKVDRESGFAIASRRLASQARRYFFAHRPALHSVGAKATCRIMAVGPRRCLVECYGHDINLTQRELRYTAIPDLREVYHPGQELDCIIKGYDAGKAVLTISVKETESNPFDGAELRHPVGSRRQATIAGKYGGGVFCNLPDGAVCMCNYAYQYKDSDFVVGDTVILAVQRFDTEKKQMYGKILTKW